MKGEDVAKEARREIAKEKARIYGRKTEQAPILEQEWRWERRKDEKKEDISDRVAPIGPIEKKTDIPSKDIKEPGMALKHIFPSRLTGRKVDESIGWVPYRPWREEGEQKKSRRVNTATIFCFAKKLIAKEWRRALGKRREDPRVSALERMAASWEQKKEEEKRRAEEEKIKIEKQKGKVEKYLDIFGGKLLEVKDRITTEQATKLFKETLEGVGEVMEVIWTGEGCEALIEPWEEKRLRRQKRDTLPVIYRLKIDDKLEITSYEPIEDEDVRVRKQKGMLMKPLEISLEPESLKTDGESAIKKLLENKLEEIGRIVEINRINGGWSAKIEPWEEMRVRNIERGGGPPVITHEVEAKLAEGKLVLFNR